MPTLLADALADVDLDIRLDDALAPECDMEDDCHTTARWTMRCEECSEVSFACQEHRDVVDKLSAALYGNDIYGVVCTMCEAPFPNPIRWLPL